MSTKRFALTVFVAFVVAQAFAIIIHGFVLGADYKPFYGTLLRPMEEKSAMVLLLPIAHLAFTFALVWVYARLTLSGSPLRQGLQLGLAAWLLGPVPMYLLWSAEQPWPGGLLPKQLILELVAMLVLGVVIAALGKKTTGPAA